MVRPPARAKPKTFFFFFFVLSCLVRVATPPSLAMGVASHPDIAQRGGSCPPSVLKNNNKKKVFFLFFIFYFF
jgi:hypothetical protein